MDKRCDTCFYSQLENDQHPCNNCFFLDKYIPLDLYIKQPKSSEYNAVEMPKHYMLFEDLGIEVRDVIEKLSWKLYQSGQCAEVPLFIADYVQMMQYLMRFMDKNGVEDLKKARVYLNWMIEAYDGTDD